MGVFQYQTRLRGIKRMTGSVSQVTVVPGGWEATKLKNFKPRTLPLKVE